MDESASSLEIVDTRRSYAAAGGEVVVRIFVARCCRLVGGPLFRCGGDFLTWRSPGATDKLLTLLSMVEMLKTVTS